MFSIITKATALQAVSSSWAAAEAVREEVVALLPAGSALPGSAGGGGKKREPPFGCFARARTRLGLDDEVRALLLGASLKVWGGMIRNYNSIFSSKCRKRT
jgi:hypothetical protein